MNNRLATSTWPRADASRLIPTGYDRNPALFPFRNLLDLSASPSLDRRQNPTAIVAGTGKLAAGWHSICSFLWCLVCCPSRQEADTQKLARDGSWNTTEVS